MNSINGILYINIEKRKDRLKNITEQLFDSSVAKETPIPPDIIQRIDAIVHKKGEIGCAKSHIKALDIAIENNWKRVMILEDDFAWKSETAKVVESLQSIDNLDFDWDVILLATPKPGLKILGKKSYNLERVNNAQTTTGYIVNGLDYMIKIKECFEKCVKELEKGAPKRKSAIDIAWKQFQPTDNWYYFKDNIGKQINSYSDIERRSTRYTTRTF